MASKLGSLLKKAKKTTEKKPTKTQSPQATIPDLDDTLDKWLKGKQMEKDGSAMRKQAETTILPLASEERRKACRDSGTFHSSIVINDKVTVSTQAKYSPIDSDEEEAIKEILGEDDFNRYFKEKTDVSITPSLLNDDDAMAKIIEAVGDENFTRMFSVKQTLVPTRDFYERSTMDPEIEMKAKQLKDAGILNPYKAAVKSK